MTGFGILSFITLSMVLAEAEIVNIFELDKGPNGQVFIALSKTPDHITSQDDKGTLLIQAHGFDAKLRKIIPSKGSVFDALDVEPQAQGALIRLYGTGNGASAQLVSGGILVSIGEGRPDIQVKPAAERRIIASSSIKKPDTTNKSSSTSTADNSKAEATNNENKPADYNTKTSSNGETKQSAGPTDIYEDADNRSDGPCAQQNARLDESPWDLDLLTSMAKCLAEDENLEDATEYFQRVLAFEPEHFKAALGMAQIHEKTGNLDEAARLFEVASRSAQTDGEALAARAAASRLKDR